MYRRPGPQMTIDDFILPFSGKLSANNRWIQLSRIIPWETIEKKYAEQFSYTGAPAKPLRMALGALIIKERCGYSDEETVCQITENPYLQYFIGLREYQLETPFDPSLMVLFRKRLGIETIKEINEMICGVEAGSEDKGNDDDDPGDQSGSGETKEAAGEVENEEKKPNGLLILDATCAPADIKYPTDLGLLNEAREKLEGMIDALHTPELGRKPRTYRVKARKDYLQIAKQRKAGAKKIRKAIGKQLRYIARDLRIVEKMLEKNGESGLSAKQIREWPVIKKLYEQQRQMYRTKQHRIDDRLVSISQPHIRPIVRGKASASTEFGAKVAISLVNGYSFIEELKWDNFNEGTTFQDSVEGYKRKHGCYPEAVLADTIYRNRENLRYCKDRGIRLSGPRLGRPPLQEDKEQKKIAQADAKQRIPVEGKFGEGKRCYGLGRIMAKLQETSETVIGLQFLIMNLEKKLRVFLFRIFGWYYFEVQFR